MYHPDNGHCSRFYCSEGQYYNSVSKQCLDCHSNCASCVGPSTTECTSCFSGFYLKRNPESESGDCALKQSGEDSANLIVSNDVTFLTNGKHNSQRTGTAANPFVDLRDALLKADSLGALYNSSQINIFLTKGDHFIVLEEDTVRFSTLGQPTTHSTDETSLVIK